MMSTSGRSKKCKMQSSDFFVRTYGNSGLIRILFFKFLFKNLHFRSNVRGLVVLIWKCILSCVPAFPALELFTLVSRAFFCVPPCVRNNAKDESKKSSLQSITEKRPDVKRHIGCQMKLIDLQKGFLRVVYQAFVLS